MVKRLSGEEFLKNLSDSGLFSQQEISKSLDSLSEPLQADGEAVARHLITAGKLTPFQAQAVSQGRIEGLVIGNHEVLERLGEGGMGTVYKARHRRMKRVVAIKVLSRVAQSENFLPRFQREVEAVARLSHPNIVMAYDADEAQVGHFLVMEFVDGRDLATEVRQRGPLPVNEAAQCVVQAARALEYVHGQGIVHRDIKPANLLRDKSGVVKVADLGLARVNDSWGGPAERNSLTQAGTIMGTVDFMSPEQALGLMNTDHRADIYSLGCTLYFLLTGRPLYEAQTMMATLLKHRDDPIPSLRESVKSIPIELDAIFRRMVAKAPGDRFQSMAEVVRALEAIGAGPGETTPDLSDRTMIILPEVAPRAELASPDSRSGPAAVQPERAQTIDPIPLITSLKLLLVEPSRAQSGIIRKYLQAQGAEHTVAVASGREALEAMRRESPDIALSAMHLPDMTGVELAQQVRRQYGKDAPSFVLISSEAERADATGISKCGNVVLLQKPFTPEQLGEALRLVLAKAQSAPAAARSPVERSGLRALIVDDSAAARAHMRSVLERIGLTNLLEAHDGAQAVAVVARERFDLIVTDYNMPLMDGRGLVGYLRQNPATESVPIIMVTTEKDPVKLEEVRRLRVTVCDKSFPFEVVRQIVDQLG